jgi:dipeptidyl aminopeptidase/acylaminoacyl peptidase
VDGLESFVAFGPGGRDRVIVAHQSPTEPPNLHLVDLGDGSRRALTDLRDPFPELTGASKTILRYRRADGVPLSGTLHLPPGETAGARRLPLIVWAYPMDFSDPDTAGQVRASDQTFTRPLPLGPLWFLLRGWAVLDGAAMPVVGDPDTMNDTFVEQVVASARAALDELDRRGIVDLSRVVVGGHSYGGFMTATLLAHSDLFAAGIARSGAYNRTLTPFGFQTERRSFWEAPDVYVNVSPFRHADKIKAPILLVHGEADSNSGTYPLQSERLFQALQGLGGTARLVVLPHEDHGYRARESVLHVIAEQLDWVERWAPARLSAEARPA